MAKSAGKAASSSSRAKSNATAVAPVLRIASPASSVSSALAASRSETDSDSDSDVDKDDDGAAAVSRQKGKGKEHGTARQIPKYKPIEGYAVRTYGASGIKAEEGVEHEAEGSGIDWEELAEDAQLELWAVRIPHGVKPKHFDGVTLQLPSITGGSSTMGQLTAKKVQYDITLIDSNMKGKRKRDEEAESTATAGGRELSSLVPLLSNRSKGDQLFVAPRPIARHLVLTRSLPPSVLSHRPSTSSSLISAAAIAASVAPSVPTGASSSKKQKLAEAVVIAPRPAKIRVQPAGLKFRLCVAGMGVSSGTVLGRVRAPKEGQEDVEMDEGDVKVKREADAVVTVKNEHVQSDTKKETRNGKSEKRRPKSEHKKK